MDAARSRDLQFRPSLPHLSPSALAARFRSMDLRRAPARPADPETAAEAADLAEAAAADQGTSFDRLLARRRAHALRRLCAPCAVVVGPDGRIFVADWGNHRIQAFDARGGTATLAGTGRDGFAGDGGAASHSRLAMPHGLALDPRGFLYISDAGNRRIRRVSGDGTISTIAGTGRNGFSGDGGPATLADVSVPSGLAVDRFGGVLVADALNHRVRRIGPDGIITTLAGGGSPVDDLGDGGLAVQARLCQPHGLAIDAAGRVYIADTGHQRIRRVDPDGLISTVAGSGGFAGGLAGDGGPAAAALLCYPKGVAIDRRGSLFIADSGNRRVRRVSPDGEVVSVAGAGANGVRGDGGPAMNAALCHPTGLALDRRGRLFIADSGDHRIRRIDPDGTIGSAGA